MHSDGVCIKLLSLFLCLFNHSIVYEIVGTTIEVIISFTLSSRVRVNLCSGMNAENVCNKTVTESGLLLKECVDS